MTDQVLDWQFTIYPISAVADSESQYEQWCDQQTLIFRDRLEKIHEENQIEYVKFNCEICPKTGRFHFQGYVRLHQKHKRRRSGVQRLLGFPTCHVEIAAHPDCLDKYCGKVETRVDGPYTIGIMKTQGQGKRTDLTDAMSLLIASRSLNKLAITYPTTFVKYPHGFRDFLKVTEVQDTLRPMPKLTICFGPTGTGKSKYAFDEAAKLPGQTYWWTRPQNSGCYALGYLGQEKIVLDEYYSWLPLDLLLRLVDRYPLWLNTQGSSVLCRAEHIWITTNVDPRTFYLKVREKNPKALAPLWNRVQRGDGMVLEFSESLAADTVAKMSHQWMMETVVERTTPETIPYAYTGMEHPNPGELQHEQSSKIQAGNFSHWRSDMFFK